MNNISKIREIYKECFGEDTEFENLLFETCGKYLKVYEIGGEPVSFLFALPCKIENNGFCSKAVYIFAAATHKDHRKRGYMGALIEKLKQNTDTALILRPANDGLISYYKKFGFKEFTSVDTCCGNISLLPQDGFKKLAENTDRTTDSEFVAMSFNSQTDLNGLYFPYTMP